MDLVRAGWIFMFIPSPSATLWDILEEIIREEGSGPSYGKIFFKVYTFLLFYASPELSAQIVYQLFQPS